MKVVVVGAGIAGLAAAWDLVRGQCDVTLLESERRPGGVIVTEHRDGFLIEGGPDGFLASEPELPALAAELGLADHVVAQQARGTAIWSGNTLAPIEEGRAATLLGIETRGADVTAGFRTFVSGMAEPVAALAERLSGVLRYAQGVAGLMRERNRWRVAITGGSAHDADAIVLALPAYASGRLLASVGINGARELAAVTYLPSTTVSMAYRREQIGTPLAGAGFVVDPQAVGAIRACTFASEKFPGRAPADHVLLRAFLSPADGDPARLAQDELARMLRIRGAPLWSRAFHWIRGLPRYPKHHAHTVADVRRRLARLPPLAIAGAGYDGAGVSACLRSGREAARLIGPPMTR